MSALRDVITVARFEVSDALRTRRVLALVILYVGGAAFGSYLFSEVLASIEETLGSTLAVTAPDRPGAMGRALVQTEEFRAVLRRLLRDEKLADQLLSVPPVALFYGWLGITFVPVFVMLTASETISQELGSGSARYALVRTDPLLWSVGKLVGQGLMMTVNLLAGGFAAFLVALLMLDSLDTGPTLGWMLALSGRAAAMGFSHLGLALGLSQLTRSVAVARALGLGSLALLGALRGILRSDWVLERAPVVSATLQTFIPRGHVLDLWRPALADRLPALLMLIALGVCFFAAGFAYRRRRDL